MNKKQSTICPVCKKTFHWNRKLFLERGKYNKIGRPRSPKRDDFKIRELRAGGKSLRDISKELDISLGIVRRSLKV